MDPKYDNAEIFNRRKNEWVLDDIKNKIEFLFSKIDLIENWKLEKCIWVSDIENPPENKKRKIEELKKNLFKELYILVKNEVNNREMEYIIQLPVLIQDQFFYIGGNVKLPMFQLTDFPTIFRGNFIKFKSNTISLSINVGSNFGEIYLFNKKIKIEDLLVATYSKLELEEFFKNKLDNVCLNELFNNCMDKISNNYISQSIIDIGKNFCGPNGDPEKKGWNVVFSLLSAYEIDFLIHPFMETNSILFELLNTFYIGVNNDTDLNRKRIRYSEYILSPLIKKVYDLVYTLNNNKRSKFQIPQTIIIEKCNVSEIVRGNYSMNPVGEIASLCQCTLTGPGGFKKDNVPAHLRNIDESHFGRICSADTPDREGCGIVLNLVPKVNIDNDGKFGEPNNEVVNSYPISLVPFLKNNDQTRLQMSSNQTKQALLIEDNETPWIKSGTEGCYLENSTFFHLAKDNGLVIHLDNSFMIVLYEDKTTEIFNIGYRELYLNSTDFIEAKFNEGDKFKKGDILCSSNFIDNGELSLGKNLLTAIAIWKGFNYEDGIVINESVKNKFTSHHCVDLSFSIDEKQVLLSLNDDDKEYIPIPKLGTKLKKGEVFARIKSVSEEEGIENINMEPMELKVPIDCEIIDIKIYPNKWETDITQYNYFITHLMNCQKSSFLEIVNKLKGIMPNEELENFIISNNLSSLDCEALKGKYTFRGKKFKGISFEIKAIYKEKIDIGDKISNRHGNKGIISRVVPDELMPTLEDGRKIEIIINPLGIISRMNAGQLFELQLNQSLYDLKNILKTFDENKMMNILEEYLSIVDNTKDGWVKDKILSEFISNKEKLSLNEAIDKLYLICPPFEDLHPSALSKLSEISDTNYKFKIFDPSSGMELKNSVYCGYMFFLKLVHRATDKISARSIGPYNRKTLQPLGGKSRLGGHKLGEMEVWALLSHGATDFLIDLLTIHSDSPSLKNKFLAKTLENEDLTDKETNETKPQSLKLLSSYMKVLGIDLIEEDHKDD